MNITQSKLSLFWLLVPPFLWLLFSHHSVLAEICILPILLLLRIGLCRPGEIILRQRFALALNGAILFIMIFGALHKFYPFPAWAVTSGKIVAALVWIPIIAMGVYDDLHLFRSLNK